MSRNLAASLPLKPGQARLCTGLKNMVRKFIDCRDVPGAQCTVAIFAESEEELLEAAIQHAVSAHGCLDTPELRERLRMHFKTEKRRAICG